MTLLTGRNLYRTGLEYNVINVDRQAYLGVTSLAGEWAYQANQFERFSLSAQYSQLRYDNMAVFQDRAKTIQLNSGASQRDSDLYSLQASWTHTLAHSWNPVLGVALNFGQERNLRNRPEYSRQLAGLRGNVLLQPRPHWTFSGALTYQHSRYEDHFSGQPDLPRRQDRYAALELGAMYTLDRQWSIKAEATLAEQASNIGLFDYGRNVVALKLRYDFK